MAETSQTTGRVSQIAALQIVPIAPLTMGVPSTRSVQVNAYDASGQLIQGQYAQAIDVSTTDKRHRVSLSGSALTQSGQTLTLTYDGKGDQFELNARCGAASTQMAMTTTLAEESLFGPPSTTGGPFVYSATLGPDGDLWSPIAANGSLAAARITPRGILKTFADPDSQHVLDSSASVLGSDNDVWFDFRDNATGSRGIARVTPTGTFATFLFQGAMAQSSVTTMTLGPDGAVWFGFAGAQAGIARVDASGAITPVAYTGQAPVNLVTGPDKNLWFSMGFDIAKLTVTGTMWTYAIPWAPETAQGFSFIVGPDGNFWAPHPYGLKMLIKINTSGTVVANIKLPYSTPWMPSTPVPPYSGSLAFDSSGNLYETDYQADGLMRVTPAGTVSEYPLYSTIFSAAQGDPEDVVTGPAGKLYLTDLAQRSTGTVGGLTVVDTAAW
jgi:streptogramin lyase